MHIHFRLQGTSAVYSIISYMHGHTCMHANSYIAICPAAYKKPPYCSVLVKSYCELTKKRYQVCMWQLHLYIALSISVTVFSVTIKGPECTIENLRRMDMHSLSVWMMEKDVPVEVIEEFEGI